MKRGCVLVAKGMDAVWYGCGVEDEEHRAGGEIGLGSMFTDETDEGRGRVQEALAVLLVLN